MVIYIMKIIIVRKGYVAMKRIAVLTSGGDSPGMNAVRSSRTKSNL